MAIDTANSNNTSNQKPSACEVQCKSQQEALATCMNSIRDARERIFQQTNNNGEENSSSVDSSMVDTTCLAPSVASWTECCSKANNGAVEVNQGHIGI